jgi:glutamate--cysteine ligase regulatory subunit
VSRSPPSHTFSTNIRLRNIVADGASAIGRPSAKSDSELTTSLRSNFESSRYNASTDTDTGPSYQDWTTREDSTLYIPSLEPSLGLSEERSAYDITVKLFYLPGIPSTSRCQHTKQALECVLKELGVDSINLLIVSFPNIVFDADDESEEDEDVSDSASQHSEGCNTTSGAAEDINSMLQTWRTIETLHTNGTVQKLGLAEFGTQRLAKFLSQVSVRPTVDQINVRDCCVVPRPLIMYAKQEGIELLTHSDCTNILPRGTLRELLGDGENGVGVLRDDGQGEGLRGDVVPQWVVKYTAVVRDRGIVESKGYFAVAELKEG